MKKLFLALSLVPSIALAHPGHHGEASHDALLTNPIVILVLLAAVCVALFRAGKVRS